MREQKWGEVCLPAHPPPRITQSLGCAAREGCSFQGQGKWGSKGSAVTCLSLLCSHIRILLPGSHSIPFSLLFSQV